MARSAGSEQWLTKAVYPKAWPVFVCSSLFQGLIAQALCGGDVSSSYETSSKHCPGL